MASRSIFKAFLAAARHPPCNDFETEVLHGHWIPDAAAHQAWPLCKARDFLKDIMQCDHKVKTCPFCQLSLLISKLDDCHTTQLSPRELCQQIMCFGEAHLDISPLQYRVGVESNVFGHINGNYLFVLHQIGDPSPEGILQGFGRVLLQQTAYNRLIDSTDAVQSLRQWKFERQRRDNSTRRGFVLCARRLVALLNKVRKRIKQAKDAELAEVDDAPVLNELQDEALNATRDVQVEHVATDVRERERMRARECVSSTLTRASNVQVDKEAVALVDSFLQGVLSRRISDFEVWLGGKVEFPCLIVKWLALYFRFVTFPHTAILILTGIWSYCHFPKAKCPLESSSDSSPQLQIIFKVFCPATCQSHASVVKVFFARQPCLQSSRQPNLCLPDSHTCVSPTDMLVIPRQRCLCLHRCGVCFAPNPHQRFIALCCSRIITVVYFCCAGVSHSVNNDRI